MFSFLFFFLCAVVHLYCIERWLGLVNSNFSLWCHTVYPTAYWLWYWVKETVNEEDNPYRPMYSIPQVPIAVLGSLWLPDQIRPTLRISLAHGRCLNSTQNVPLPLLACHHLSVVIQPHPVPWFWLCLLHGCLFPSYLFGVRGEGLIGYVTYCNNGEDV